MRPARILVPLSLVLVLLVCASPGLAAAKGAVPSPDKAMSSLVNINTASAEELQQIKGIGPSLAQRILAHREKNGPFQRVEEIMNVRGIGEKTFLRFKDRITVGKPAAREN